MASWQFGHPLKKSLFCAAGGGAHGTRGPIYKGYILDTFRGIFIILTLHTTHKVALLIESSNAYARGIMHGIAAFMRERQPWGIYLSESNRGEPLLDWLTRWKVDGIIARIENEAIARVVRRLRTPTVDVSAARLVPSLPWVETDDASIAKIAAEHLLERGFKHFGYCGDNRFNWSIWRQKRFEELIRIAGHSCSAYCSPARRSVNEENEIGNIAKWVAGLPKPSGIMACYDYRGRQVLNACRRLDIAVPDEVAVIGVDNDDLLCDLADPPMSSVIPNPYRTGYAAAALLARLLAGERVKAEAHLIAPLGVTTRQSTDVLAIDDRNIAAAVRFIREHAYEGIRVKDILKAVPQSRRLFEYRFKKLIGRTPHAEIMRVQLNHAKLLLAESDMSLEQIAERVGFSHAEYLSTAFHREEGLPPGRYRVLNRARSDGFRPAP